MKKFYKNNNYLITIILVILSIISIVSIRYLINKKCPNRESFYVNDKYTRSSYDTPSSKPTFCLFTDLDSKSFKLTCNLYLAKYKEKKYEPYIGKVYLMYSIVDKLKKNQVINKRDFYSYLFDNFKTDEKSNFDITKYFEHAIINTLTKDNIKNLGIRFVDPNGDILYIYSENDEPSTLSIIPWDNPYL